MICCTLTLQQCKIWLYNIYITIVHLIDTCSTTSSGTHSLELFFFSVVISSYFLLIPKFFFQMLRTWKTKFIQVSLTIYYNKSHFIISKYIYGSNFRGGIVLIKLVTFIAHFDHKLRQFFWSDPQILFHNCNEHIRPSLEMLTKIFSYHL